MLEPYQVTDDVFALPSFVPIPGMGGLTVNAYVIKSRDPVLVDTGIKNDSPAFMEALKSVIDPKDLRWVWLTHDDADHTGSIAEVMAAAPQARLATNALCIIRMGTWWPVPMDRTYALNPGDSIDAGDRTLTGVRPPLFDNPTATGFVDGKGHYFCVDCFGAILPSPARDADEIPEETLEQGMSMWASADSPWVHGTDPDKYARSLENVRGLDAKVVFSAHLPPAKGMTDRLIQTLRGVPTMEPFVTPNQAALLQMLGKA